MASQSKLNSPALLASYSYSLPYPCPFHFSLLTSSPVFFCSLPTVIQGLRPAKSHENASISEIDFSIS